MLSRSRLCPFLLDVKVTGLRRRISQPRRLRSGRVVGGGPGEFLERLVDGGVGQVVGVVRHHLLAVAEDHLEDVAPGETRVEEGMHSCVVKVAPVAHQRQGEIAQRLEPGIGQRCAIAQRIGDRIVDSSLSKLEFTKISCTRW